MNRPHGFRSAHTGVRRLTRSKSSMVSGTPISRASASRWRTALVEPPLAATPAIAFSNAARVAIWRGRRPRRSMSITSAPDWRPTSSLAGSVAAMLAVPMGESPRNSSAIAIVLAVNCPPHAPAPGQTTSSSSFRSWSLIFPAALAPTASKRSWMVTSRPRKRPGWMEPP